MFGTMRLVVRLGLVLLLLFGVAVLANNDSQTAAQASVAWEQFGKVPDAGGLADQAQQTWLGLSAVADTIVAAGADLAALAQRLGDWLPR